jgi:radical SAM protein with 4Fe4S-binding SPASM domain
VDEPAPAPPPELVQIVLEVTYKCTHDCIFCYNCWKHEYPVAPELTTAQFEGVLSRFPQCRQVSLSGGEPLLRPDIIEIVKAARKRARLVSLLTTGELLTPGLADALGRLGVFLQIPIHGTEATHESLTRRRGSYRRALEAMALLAERRMPFGTSTVVMKQNLRELPAILELSAAMGACENISIRFLQGGEGMKRPEQVLSREDAVLMLKALDRAAGKLGIRTALGVPNLPCVIDEKPFRRVNFGQCGAGVDWFTVDPSGRMRICNHSPTILGDLTRQGFAELWRHPVLVAMRSGGCVPGECAGCERVSKCKGGCRAAGETLCGSLSAPDPLFSHRPFPGPAHHGARPPGR